jgi:hypothetical protein
MKLIFNISSASAPVLPRVKRALRIAAGAAVASGALFAREETAQANPRPLPFTYPYETLPEGATEVELYTDMTPLRVQADPADATKGRLWENFYRLQTEFEYGITDRFELGLYQVFEANPQAGGGNVFSFDGLKARIRTRLAEAGEWPVDVGLYFEVSDFHDELELEQKIILGRRFGHLRVMSNLWVEEEFERPFDDSPHRGEMEVFFNPTLGATYELSPRIQVGLEYWTRGRIGGDDDDESAAPADAAEAEARRIDRRNDGFHHFLGPTFHYNMGRAWLSVGVYSHLNDANKPQPGEAYGPWWARTVLGVDL